MREYLRLTVAGAVSITGLILWRRYVEQLTRSRDILGAPTIGEETVVTDTVETVGQDVDEEAAYDSSPPDLGRGQYRRRIRPSELPAMVVLLPVRCATPPGA
jgi:hypothetical protein